MSQPRRPFGEGAPATALETTAFTLLYTMCEKGRLGMMSSEQNVLNFRPPTGAKMLNTEVPWLHGLPEVVHEIFYPLYFVQSYQGYVVLFWLCLGTLTATLALIAFTAFSLNRGRFQWMWPLIMLRNLSALITTVFFMPFLEIFVMMIVCKTGDSGQIILSEFEGHECFGSHLPLFILAIVGLLITLPFGLFLNYIYVIPRPDSKNPMAKAHGILDVLYFILKTVLVFVSLFAGIGPRLIVPIIINAILILTYLQYMPHFSHRVNALRISIFVTSLASSIIALIANSLPAGNTSHVPVAILVTMVPFGLGGGYLLTERVYRGKVQRIMGRLRQRLEMQAMQPEENKLRGDRKPQLLHTALLEKRTSGQLKRRASSRFDIEAGNQGGGSNNVTTFGERDRSAGSKDLPVIEMMAEVSDLAAIEQYKEVFAKRAIHLPVVFSTSMDADIACRFLRDNEVSAASRKIMTLIFDEALEQYPKEAQLALMYTFYLSRWGDDADMCLRQLHCAKSYHPALDVRFRIFMEERDFQQNTRSEDLGAMEYQSLERQAISSHLASLVAIKTFWTFLSSDNVDAGALAAHLNNMHKWNAVQYYEKIIARFPSKQIIRMYAKYMLTIANNPEMGDQLLKRAEDIEHQEGSGNLYPDPLEKADPESPAAPPATFGLGPHPNVSALRAETIPEAPSREGTPPPMRKNPIFALKELGMGMGGRSASFDMAPSFSGVEIPRPGHGSLPRPGGLLQRTSSQRKTALKVEDWVQKAPVARETSFLERDEEQGRQQVQAAQPTFGANKSQASSTSSSKELRRLKARQMRLTENLLAPIVRLSVFVRICCFALLGLLIANYLVSSSLFNAPNSYLSTLEDATRARRGAMLAAQEMRLMSVYAQGGNEDIWQYHHSKLSAEAGRFQTLILPILFGNVNDPPTAPILRASTPSFTSVTKVTLYNAFTLGQMLSNSLSAVLLLDYTAWTSSSVFQSIDFRMWMDNVLAIGDALDGFAKASLTSYLKESAARNILVIALMLICIAVLAVTATFMNLMIRHARGKQRIVLKALNHISHKDRRRILDMVEEEVEEFLEYETEETAQDTPQQAVAVKSINSSRQHTVIFILALIFLGCISIALFIPPLISLAGSDVTAKTIMLSNNRRYTYQVIGFLSNELPAGDTNTWAPYRVQHELTYRIYDLQQQHAALLDGTAGVPSTDSIPELTATCRTGGVCLTTLGCDDRPFNASIGYTQALLLSGIDSIIDIYLDHVRELLNTESSGRFEINFLLYQAQRFLLSPTYSYDNADLYFLDNLEDDLADGLTTVDTILLQVAQNNNAVYIEYEKVLFSVAIVYFVSFYIFSFMKMFRSIRAHMAQITACIFWIPPDIAAASADLTKFMVTGLVEDDKE
ncbi:hypothetical protein HKX48_007763 [Thoreauomyces humboldtii]|nr:hypothetical protein HKX48_007763 [Thoreauomyces humboldtii]